GRAERRPSGGAPPAESRLAGRTIRNLRAGELTSEAHGTGRRAGWSYSPGASEVNGTPARSGGRRCPDGGTSSAGAPRDPGATFSAGCEVHAATLPPPPGR